MVFEKVAQSTELRFANFLSGGFITVIVVNPSERKLAKHTSVHLSVAAPSFVKQSMSSMHVMHLWCDVGEWPLHCTMICFIMFCPNILKYLLSSVV